MVRKRLGPMKKIKTGIVADFNEKACRKICDIAYADVAAIEKIDCSDEKTLLLNHSYYILYMQKEICNYFRILSGEYKNSGDVCNAVRVLRNFASMAEQIISENERNFDISIPDGKVYIPLGENELCHTLAALVVNSMEHTETGDKIGIYLEEDAKWVKIVVSDTGTGMDEDTLKHCKEPLFSGRKLSKNKTPLGLGLTIADYIIKSIGGCIKIKSILNKGTKFCICIPKSDENTFEEIHSSLPSVNGYTKEKFFADFAPAMDLNSAE